MKITFYGAAGEVTGSCYHIVLGDGTELLVDAGFYQDDDSMKKNYELPPLEWPKISHIILTHGHLDHCGRLPAYYKSGFRGKIIATPPTKDLASILWQDNARILADHARFDRQEPLYTEENAWAASELFQVADYNQPVKVGAAQVKLFDAGHILGSASVNLSEGGVSLVVSGDLGNTTNEMVKDTVYPGPADAVIMESTYGDRIHTAAESDQQLLKNIILDVIKRKAALLIPAFAIERSQNLIYDLNDLVESGAVPEVPVFLDSPMAIDVINVFKKHKNYLSEELLQHYGKGDDPFVFNRLKFTDTTEESKQINALPGPKIIIAGSGMMNGGRVVHHLKRILPDPQSTVLIVGYQVEGTVGRHVQNKERTIMVDGRRVPLRCQVVRIESYSAHADQTQLLAWLGKFSPKPPQLYLVHGDQVALTGLQGKIKEDFALSARIARYGESFEI